MNDVDPPRLADLGLPGLDALDEARRRGPSDEAVVRLAAKLGIGGPPPAGPAGPSSAAPAAKIAAMKALGALAISATAAVAAWQLTHRHGALERRPSAHMHDVSPAPNPATADDFKVPEAPAIVASAATPVTDAQASPSASAKPRTVTELELIGKAERALHSDPTGALRLAKEHARLFPRGLLAQERDVLAIDALARLGRIDEARARADVFASAYPSSPHNQRLRRLLRRATGLDGGP